MRSPFLLTAILLSLSLILAACQAAPTPTPTSAPAPTTSPAAAVPASTKPPAPTATPAPKVAPKGKIVVAHHEVPISFDIAREDNGVRVAARSVREPLADLAPTSMELIPALAESWERTRADAWQFKLRKGIKFHNGEPFNADAVVYSLKRQNDPQLGATSSLTQNALVKDINRLDEYTIEVITKEPDPIQPMRLTRWNIEAPKWMQENPELIPVEAIGTGPYKFANWEQGQYIQITADENYWGEPKPTIKDVVIMVRKEVSTRAAGVKAGEFDIGSLLTPEQCQEVKCVTQTTSVTPMVRVNTLHPVLKDKRVRQALSYGIDRQLIVSRIFGGFAVPASQLVAPFVMGYNPDLKPYPYDLEKAKRLIKEAGAEGTELSFWWRPGRFPRDSELVEYMLDAWKRLGLTVKSEARDAAGMREAYYAIAPDKPRTDLLMQETSNDWGDSSQQIGAKLLCGGATSHFCDEQVEKLWKGTSSASWDERIEILRQIWAYVYDLQPNVDILHLVNHYGVSERLKWEPSTTEYIYFKYMSLVK